MDLSGFFHPSFLSLLAVIGLILAEYRSRRNSVELEKKIEGLIEHKVEKMKMDMIKNILEE